jgi:hypothetical protein
MGCFGPATALEDLAAAEAAPAESAKAAAPAASRMVLMMFSLMTNAVQAASS